MPTILPLTKERFKTAIWKHKLTFRDLKKLHKKGLLSDDDFVFTLPGVLKISETAGRGLYVHGIHTKGEPSKWVKEKGGELVKQFITNAFEDGDTKNKI